MAHAAILAIAYLKEVGVTMGDVVNYYGDSERGGRNHSGDTKRFLRNAASALAESGYEDVDELVSLMREQISSYNRGEGPDDGSLVELIVNTLQLSYPRNRITSREWQTLRRAILLPEEMAKLSETVRSREIGCANCGHELRDHEMTSVQRGSYGGGSGGIGFLCLRCRVPVYAACTKGDACVVPLDKKLVKALQNVGTCGNHSADGVRAPTPMENPFAAAAATIVGRTARPTGRGPFVRAPQPIRMDDGDLIFDGGATAINVNSTPTVTITTA